MLRLKPDDDVLARENRGHVKFDVRIVCQNYIFCFKKFVKLRDDLTYRAEEELTVEVENSDFIAGFLPDVDFVVGINFCVEFFFDGGIVGASFGEKQRGQDNARFYCKNQIVKYRQKQNRNRHRQIVFRCIFQDFQNFEIDYVRSDFDQNRGKNANGNLPGRIKSRKIELKTPIRLVFASFLTAAALLIVAAEVKVKFSTRNDYVFRSLRRLSFARCSPAFYNSKTPLTNRSRLKRRKLRDADSSSQNRRVKRSSNPYK